MKNKKNCPFCANKMLIVGLVLLIVALAAGVTLLVVGLVNNWERMVTFGILLLVAFIIGLIPFISNLKNGIAECKLNTQKDEEKNN
jgi:membrane protein YdbS with pleckstrin-like domain